MKLTVKIGIAAAIAVCLSLSGTLLAGEAPSREDTEKMVDRTSVTVSTITFGLPDPNEDVPRFTKAENLAKAKRLLDVAGQRGSDIVCLPELFSTKRTANQREAEEIPGGETSKMLSEAARKWKMYVMGCYYEKDGDKIYNSVAIFGRDGQHVGTYHKVHLPPGERDYATPGNSFPVFETDFGKVGALVCIDIHFPEAARSLALAGAEIVFCPTMYSGPRESITYTLYKARAIENNIFTVCSNYSQKQGWHLGFGAIINRYGEILANTGKQEDVATAIIDLDEECPMAGIDKWATRRPDAYGIITKE
ncbi:MAG: carbon-nitrogen hydrolase family protein [Planctomycetes bacterium]|nr:carbon-nitrogen hydrolase family protein [Planctomycetota bacterium]